MKPKLLILTTTFPRWKNDPDPPFVYDLAKRLARDFEITVHAPHYRGAETKEILDDMRIIRFRYFFEPLEKLAGNTGILPTIRNNKFYLILVPFLVFAQFSSLIIFLLRNRINAIHAHWVLPQGMSAMLASFFFRIPFIVTAHGSDIFSMQGKFFQYFKSIVLRRAECITVVSKSLAISIQNSFNLDADHIRIMPMGVSADHFNPAAKNTEIHKRYNIKGPLILYVGRLSAVKGVSYLIDAMPAVLSIFPETCLLIVGHGELRDKLQQKVKRLELVENIYFIGPVSNSDLPMYYASADIFIGPSIRTEAGEAEGFGLTFVEAAMSGCLLIGTNVGGITDIITDNETGLLVAEKDSEALAGKIIYALRNMGKLEPVRKKGREKCKEFYDWNVVAQKYADLLLAVSQSKQDS